MTIEKLIERLKSCPNQQAEVVLQKAEGWDADTDVDIVTTVWMKDNRKFIIVSAS